jgi:lysyl-tRNA synthetase class 1
MTERRVRHWAETIAREVISSKHEPYVVASGITTSGPIHMGTLCEFLYPSALVKYLSDEGYCVDFIFVGDIMDALDSVPKPLEKFKFLEEHIGKPLCAVPDPYRCCPSYGDHFLNEVVSIMDRLEVSAKVVRSSELLSQGKYDPYVALYYAHREKVKAIARRVAELSGVAELPEWVDILMPICENCGKIATTRVLAFDGSLIRYICDKDVKYTRGCGHVGTTPLEAHKYKLYWRLDWPSRQDFLGVSVELAGVDHHTRGGSWDTCVMIHREILGKDPPIGHKFGFVLLHGKKYSKSKGIGLSVDELLAFTPPCIIKYAMFKQNLDENKEFDPTGNSLIRLYEEYGRAADLYEKGTEHRAEDKMVLAYSLSTDRRRWRVDFADLLINYQIYRDWDKVVERLGDPEGVKYLKGYVENWVERQYLPDEYVFKPEGMKVPELVDVLRDFANNLNDSMSDVEIHDLVYSVAGKHNIRAPQLFSALYRSLISKDHGPRLGRLVKAFGASKVKDMLNQLYR